MLKSRNGDRQQCSVFETAGQRAFVRSALRSRPGYDGGSAHARILPFMVNTLSASGPDLYDSKQVIRATAPLYGQLASRWLRSATLITCSPTRTTCKLLASCSSRRSQLYNWRAESDDIMLNYQTNAYHDVGAIREILGKRPIREFEVSA